MKAVIFDTAGLPAEVLQVAERPMPEPAAGELRLRILLATINPSDLMFVQNRYGIRPVLPGSGAGFEAVGIVDACGDGVSIPIGTRMSFTTVGTWAEYAITSVKSVVPVPQDMSDETAAQLFVNPYTAYAMVLESGVAPGDYLMLSAAGSAFGKMAIQICKTLGIKTIGTVRRPDMVEGLKALGADYIIDLSTEDPARVVKTLTDGKGVPCILDAVAGPAAARLLPCLQRGGKMVVYGSLSLEDMPVPAGLLIFKDLTIKGFWLSTWLRDADPAVRREVATKVGALLADGTFQLPVEAIYPIESIAEAVRHADREGRTGKVLVRPSAGHP